MSREPTRFDHGWRSYRLENASRRGSGDAFLAATLRARRFLDRARKNLKKIGSYSRYVSFRMAQGDSKILLPLAGREISIIAVSSMLMKSLEDLEMGSSRSKRYAS